MGGEVVAVVGFAVDVVVVFAVGLVVFGGSGGVAGVGGGVPVVAVLVGVVIDEAVEHPLRGYIPVG
jgi:L-cystine uptake protein TcyP (sodium:dicarboxylate symporter family)